MELFKEIKKSQLAHSSHATHSSTFISSSSSSVLQSLSSHYAIAARQLHHLKLRLQ